MHALLDSLVHHLTSHMRPPLALLSLYIYRYIYQPIEALFLLLITNKASNIVEDLETLRLLSKSK